MTAVRSGYPISIRNLLDRMGCMIEPKPCLVGPFPVWSIALSPLNVNKLEFSLYSLFIFIFEIIGPSDSMHDWILHNCKTNEPDQLVKLLNCIIAI